jgi:hypothetical protein
MMKRGEKNHYLEGLHQQIQEQSPNVAAMIAGSVTFGSTLSMSTFLQKHLLRISTGTWPRIIPSTVGFVTVCLASWLSHRASLEAQHALSSYYYARQQQQHRLLLLPWRDTTAPVTRRYYPNNEEQGTTLSIRNSWINDEVTLPFTKRQISVWVIGVVAFKAMGGRFLSIAPSSYTSPGSFARLSTPAKSTSYATANERDAVRKIGKRYGCHTCGTRKPFYRGSDAFVADHMPPNAIVESLKKPTKQDFYPVSLWY